MKRVTITEETKNKKILISAPEEEKSPDILSEIDFSEIDKLDPSLSKINLTLH